MSRIHILDMHRIHNLASFIGEIYMSENDFPGKIDVELSTEAQYIHKYWTKIITYLLHLHEIKTNLLYKYYLILEYQHTVIGFKR